MTRKQALEAHLAAAVEKIKTMTLEELAEMYRQQRCSFVRAEAGFGTDKDEAEYRAAVARGDKDEIDRLDAESDRRAEAAEKMIAQEGEE